mmetsp:Transcript_9107/g.10562  ORF Transcript_9107/g.10562 Transcript_9107/m.10562 type:complete len:221 (+) Transcript_9107:207-869(+)
MEGRGSDATLKLQPVTFRISSTVKCGAISTNVKPPSPCLSQSKTHISVIILSTTPLPVNGRLHSGRIFGAPDFDVWSIVTTTLASGADTRSIAPPIPLSNFPGMIQLAKSPLALTCNPPNIVKSTCPPRIMEKLCELLKVLAPLMGVTVSFPALIRSGSASSSWDGYGPNPIIPFSACSSMCTSGGMKLLAMVGIPIPKLTYIPSLNSLAARLIIRALPP